MFEQLSKVKNKIKMIGKQIDVHEEFNLSDIAEQLGDVI